MARKITSKTDNKGWTDPSKKKVRKKRKPMTEEQKTAAAERLEKARAVRAAKNPDYGMTGIHESLRDLPDDYPITPKKVKQWIKTQKELASMERRNEKKNVKGATARKTSHEAYVRNLQKYLKDGDYVDAFCRSLNKAMERTVVIPPVLAAAQVRDATPQGNKAGQDFFWSTIKSPPELPGLSRPVWRGFGPRPYRQLRRC